MKIFEFNNLKFFYIDRNIKLNVFIEVGGIFNYNYFVSVVVVLTVSSITGLKRSYLIMAATKNPPTIKHPTITPKKILILYKIKSSWYINHMYQFFFL